jgi:hypothetical protein
MPDPAVEQEIVTLVREAVARHGMAGDVVIRGASIALEGYGRTVSAELGLLGEQWATLPHDVQVRRAGELARRLADARRAHSSRPPPKSGLGLGWLGPVALVVLAAAGLWGAFRFLEARGGEAQTRAGASTAATSSADAYEAARVARAARVCGATRERVLRGVSVSMTDAEGWVVELVLLRDAASPPMRVDPALDAFFAFDPSHDTARLVWAGAPALAEIGDAFSRASISALDEFEGAHLRGLTVSLSGGYVTPYFDSDRRAQYFALASALAERLGASHGALFAHCSERTTHEIGSWFRAPTPGAAAGTLTLFMATYADVPQLRPRLLSASGAAGSTVERAFAFTEIQKAARQLKYAHLRTLLGGFGGAIAGRPEGPTTVTFDFRDASRASRASYAVARDLDIAELR